MKIKTTKEAIKAIKEQHDVKVVPSIIKGFQWFLEDTSADEIGANQSTGTHFKTDKELIQTANEIC